MTKLKNLFNISYGSQLDLNKLDVVYGKDESVNFVSRGSSNLGVVCKVKIIPKKSPFKKGSITVTLGGEYLLSAYVQQDDFYTSQNIKVLIPKEPMTDTEKKFYCYVIQTNRFRYYSHGREANKTLDDIKVPSKKEIPYWVYSTKVREYKKDPINIKKLELNTKGWKNFKIIDLFDIKKGERLVKEHRVTGEIPLVTATSENNGVVEYISHDAFKENKKIFQDKLTIDMFFNVFYHDYKYFSDDNVHTLIPKNVSLNKYICLFLVTVLKKLQYKYDFGRQVRLQRLDFDEIKLPVDKRGIPDWQFMENYVKSLAYSSNL